MFNDKTLGHTNRVERTASSGQRAPRLERGGDLLPQLEHSFAGEGSRQTVHSPLQTKPGTVTFAANRGDGGGGGERGGVRRRSGGGMLGKGASMLVAGLATVYQLPARMIISGIKEAGGNVQFPWAASVTALGSIKSGPGKVLANGLGWALLVPALVCTIVTGGVSAIYNRATGRAKGEGFWAGVGKGFTGFFKDKGTELTSIANGDGPSYFNLAAQYYSESH